MTRRILPEGSSVTTICIEHFDKCLGLLQGDEFDFSKFIELSAYLELGILYDSLSCRFASGRNFDELSPLAHELEREHLFSSLAVKTFGIYEGREERIITAVTDKTSSIDPGIKWSGFFWNALADEHSLRIPFHVPFETIETYLDAVQIERSHRIYTLLFQSYAQLSTSLRTQIEELQRYVGSETVFIPPLMTLLLKKCSRPADIPYEFLEMRQRFRVVRESFKEYEETIGDQTVPLEKSIKAINELKRSLTRLTSDEPDRTGMIISEWRDGLSLLPDLDSLEDIDTNLAKILLKKPAEWIVNRIRNRKLIRLFDLKNDFLRTEGYFQLISKVFDYQLKSDDIEQSTHALSAADQLARMNRSNT